MEARKEGSLAAGSGVEIREGETTEGGGGGVDSVYEVENGGWADATKRGEHPRKEGAVAGYGTGGVLEDLFGGAGGDDGTGVNSCGGEVRREGGRRARGQLTVKSMAIGESRRASVSTKSTLFGV